MKTHTYINNLYKAVLALLLTVVCNACLDDDWGTGCAPTTGDVKITLHLQLPGISPRQANSRAMPADETTIEEIQVLLFKPGEGDLVGTYPAQDITTDPGNALRRSFSVDVIEGSFDIMVLANSKTIMDAAGLAKDMSRREVSSRLRFTQSGKIAHDASTLIPFWGELNGANIQNGATLGDITLLRALAKK